MPRDAPRPPVRIGDFIFQPQTGELRPQDSAVRSRNERLSPQPARLLELLVERQGELVTREEIRQALWPETHVDFDQGLNFCIRQIRSALDDSASEPSYIETLPRRGYRLMRPARAVEPEATETDRATTPRRSWLRTLVGIALILLLAVLWWQVRRPAVVGDPPVVRLAIMPFELAAPQAPAAATDPRGDLARMSEWLVAELAGGREGGISVLGPRSTSVYSAFPFPDLRRLREELGATHVLNARYFEREVGAELIVELIRLADGDHPWAEFFADARPWQRVAETVRDRVVEALRQEIATTEERP